MDLTEFIHDVGRLHLMSSGDHVRAGADSGDKSARHRRDARAGIFAQPPGLRAGAGACAHFLDPSAGTAWNCDHGRRRATRSGR
jgi:hypothetical protein